MVVNGAALKLAVPLFKVDENTATAMVKTEALRASLGCDLCLSLASDTSVASREGKVDGICSTKLGDLLDLAGRLS